MAESIFKHLADEWRHHRDTRPAADPASPANPTPQETPMATLTDIITDARTTIETGEIQIRTFLDQHLPQIEAALGDPLVQAAITIAADAALPAPARPVLAEMLGRLAVTYRQPAPAPLPEPQPEPQPVA